MRRVVFALGLAPVALLPVACRNEFRATVRGPNGIVAIFTDSVPL